MKTAAVALLLLTAACGGGTDAVTAAATTTETTAAPTTPSIASDTTGTTDPGADPADVTDTTEVPLTGKADDPKVRAKVQKITDEFQDEYKGVFEDLKEIGLSDEGDPIDEAIKDACQSAPNDGKLTEQEISVTAMFVGQILSKHGKDVATFAGDIAEFNRAIIKLGVCA